jgi:hypothetical protein
VILLNPFVYATGGGGAAGQPVGGATTFGAQQRPPQVDAPMQCRGRGIYSSAVAGSGFSTTDRVVGAQLTFTYTNGNQTLTVTRNGTVGSVLGTNRGAVSSATGKHYFEVEVTAITTSDTSFSAGAMGNGAIPGTGDWRDCTDQVNYRGNGQIFRDGATFHGSGASYTTGDVLGFALDLGTATLAIYKNNTLQATVTSFVPTTAFPAFWVEDYSGSPAATLRTTASTQSFSPPAGFSPWE